jgi:capsular exopolysaccharide synthesis family protein
MRSTTESEFDRPTMSGSFSTSLPGQYPAEAGGADATDLLASVWRYRWAVLIPAILGGIAGFTFFLKTPETFQASTLLMIESSRPAVIDNTGDLLGGVPSIDILRSQLFSDHVIQVAFESDHMQTFREKFNNSSQSYANVLPGSLKFEPQIQDTRAGTSMVASLAFVNQNRDLCSVSVKAFSEALQKLFAEKHKSSRTELMQLISDATDQLENKMPELEQRYRDFRTSAPLVWDKEGNAVNPHRERQLFLTQRRSELFEEMRQKATQLATVESIAKESKDAVLAIQIVGQMTGKTFNATESMASNLNLRENDLQLAQLELDERLMPLMIQRNKYAAEFGESHPTVKQLDTELRLMKSELKRLVTEQIQRVVELMEENKVEGIDPQQRAAEALNVIVIASQAEVKLLKQQVAELEGQIAIEKDEAIKLAKFEQENTAILREIERNRDLINQLEEQMARVELTEEDGGVRVSELSAPSVAYPIGPNMTKIIGMWTVLGLAAGCGLALLLEKNANTFRDPGEISNAIGVPILTHVPFFRGKVRKGKKDSPNPFEQLDPHLAVVHTPSSVPAEAIRSCRTSIFFEMAGIQGGKIIQVTSPLPGDGKSTIAGNLACSIAQSGKRTLLIDCDLRRPQITDNFACSDKLGLIDVLDGKCEHLDAIHDTPLAPLKLMPSGPIPANPAEALSLPEMSELLELMREKFDYIIVDTPPLLVVTDPSILASVVDGVVMALKIRRKSKPNTKEAAGILRTVGARILGVVINNSDESSSSDGYKGYGYYRYGRHTNRYYSKAIEHGAKSGQPRTPVVVSGRSGMARPVKLQPSPVASLSTQSDVATKMNGHAAHDQS